MRNNEAVRSFGGTAEAITDAIKGFNGEVMPTICLTSLRGEGKLDLVKVVAEETGYALITHRVSAMTVQDALKAVPTEEKTITYFHDFGHANEAVISILTGIFMDRSTQQSSAHSSAIIIYGREVFARDDYETIRYMPGTINMTFAHSTTEWMERHNDGQEIALGVRTYLQVHPYKFSYHKNNGSMEEEHVIACPSAWKALSDIEKKIFKAPAEYRDRLKLQTMDAMSQIIDDEVRLPYLEVLRVIGDSGVGEDQPRIHDIAAAYAMTTHEVGSVTNKESYEASKAKLERAFNGHGFEDEMMRLFTLLAVRKVPGIPVKEDITAEVVGLG